MSQNIQLWQFFLTIIGLMIGSVVRHNAAKEKAAKEIQQIREKVIRLEEKVNNQHDNHIKTDEMIKEMKGTLDKIWDRLENKQDKAK